MDIESRLSLSYYKEVAAINEQRGITLVQDIRTGRIFVKKVLGIYNPGIYHYLRSHPIPHTPRVYEIYEENNVLTVIEEYISGDTLSQLLEQGCQFTNDQIRNIAGRLCVILMAFHNAAPPIIHRDIKPSNVILTPSGEVFLLDFNAAKYHTETKSEDTTLLGTKGYAAPEQYGFGISTVQTDIYALGMLLNTLVLGTFSQTPAEGNDFTPLIQKCTRLDPRDRYKNVEQLYYILQKREATNTDNPTPVAKPFSSRQDTSILSWFPPGFRHLSPLRMLLAVSGYAFLFWLALTLEVENTTPISLWFQRICCLLAFLSIIFFTFNYRNIQDSLQLYRIKNVWLRFITVVLADVAILFAIMILMVFGTMLLQ